MRIGNAIIQGAISTIISRPLYQSRVDWIQDYVIKPMPNVLITRQNLIGIPPRPDTVTAVQTNLPTYEPGDCAVEIAHELRSVTPGETGQKVIMVTHHDEREDLCAINVLIPCQ
jgi:hypothetical protein